MYVAATPAAPAAVRRPATLAVLSVAQFLIALDYSIIYVALPSIAGDLRLDPVFAQWAVSAYAVLFAGFLVVGGRLADRVGAVRLFVVAVIGFGLASAVGGAAQDGATLLAARGVQGLCAALLQPAVLVVRAVGAAAVFEQPLAALEAQQRVRARDALDRDDDVRPRVPTYAVRTSWIQSHRNAVALHDKLSHEIAFPSLTPRSMRVARLVKHVAWTADKA